MLHDDGADTLLPVVAPRQPETAASTEASPEAPPGRARWSAAPPRVLAAIAAGGALGAPTRHGLAQLVDEGAGGFPWATFWTNLSGSLVLGFVLILVIERFPPTRYVRPFFAVGFLGAYTTFSTFAVELGVLVKDGHPAMAAGYALGSLVGGFGAVWCGIALGRRVPEGGRR